MFLKHYTVWGGLPRRGGGGATTKSILIYNCIRPWIRAQQKLPRTLIILSHVESTMYSSRSYENVPQALHCMGWASTEGGGYFQLVLWPGSIS